MIVVSDTSPINYLVLIGHADLLHTLFGNVVVPLAVFEELTHVDSPPAVSSWLAAPPAWLSMHRPAIGMDLGLDRGEADAISLAIEMDADAILIDERLGREVAANQQLTVIGTVGVLLRAAGADMIVLREALDALRSTSFRISDQIIDDALALDRDRRSHSEHGS